MGRTDIELLSEKFNKLLKKRPKSKAEIIEQENIRLTLEEAYKKDEEPLLKDLADIGLKIESVWDLVNANYSYKEAIPILINHLSKNYNLRNKEGIIRALTVKEAAGIACKAIINEYHNAPKDNFHYRWVFGNAIVVTISKNCLDDVIKIVQDKSNGKSRQEFVIALSKFKLESVENILIDLLSDSEVSLQAIEALGKMKSKKAKPSLKEFVVGKQKIYIKEATKALNRIG